MITHIDFENAIRAGSGFAGGRVRIAALYANDPDPADAARFLRDEYGIGGHSFTLADGTSAFVDYSGVGFSITVWKTGESKKLTWAQVEAITREIVRGADYLKPDERDALESFRLTYGTIPEPRPRYGFPKLLTPEEFAAIIPD